MRFLRVFVAVVVASALTAANATPPAWLIARSAQTRTGRTSGPNWQALLHAPPAQLSNILLMTNGTVIGQDAQASGWWKLTPDAFGDYVHGTWSQIASMPSGYGPLYYASDVLADGRVVAIGGEYNVGSGGGVWTNRGAIYNPGANSWSNLGAPGGWSDVGDAQCAVFPDGRLMLAHLDNTECAVLNPTTLLWTPVGSGKTDRFDEEGWTLLPEGTILTVDANNAPHCEKFVISLGQWMSAGSTPQSLEDPGSEEIGPAVLRPNGTVFATGGTGHNAVYTPGGLPTDTGSWVAAPDFPIVSGVQLDVADGPACLLPSGNVLCDASPGIYNPDSHFYEFDGTHLNAVPAPPGAPYDPSYVGVMLMLPTGQVLFTDQSSDVEVYTPVGVPNNAWRPTITICPTTIAPHQSFVLSGTQLNGLSQCSAYGDDATNATNYPLVRITNGATGHVQYCRTHDHSTMAVATGSAVVSTHVDVPLNIELGAATLTVVTNGISSAPYPITVGAKTVSGVVTLQNYVASAVAGTLVTIEIRPVGLTTPLETDYVSLNADGSFSFVTSVPNGIYDIAAKGIHWLRRKLGSQTVTANGVGGLAYSLINGDVNGDNTVSLADFGQLRTAYGSSFGDPHWNPNADLNGDHVVSLADFGILRANFGLSGDP